MKNNEQGVLTAILQYLRLLKIPHGHFRNSGRIIHRPGGKIVFGKSPLSQPGIADILACYKGHALAIEVKAPAGRVRPEQMEWLEAWEKNGGKAIIARSVDDVEALLKYLDANGTSRGQNEPQG
jgi:hypothetical protein